MRIADAVQNSSLSREQGDLYGGSFELIGRLAVLWSYYFVERRLNYSAKELVWDKYECI